MSWSYAYSPDLWPVLVSFILIVFLGWYIWRRRSVPGARALAIAAGFGALWIVGVILEGAATGPSAKVFWFIFQGVWQLPVATAIFCFVLEYAGLGRWLTRRNLLLLWIPTIIVLAVILTNGLHHSMWQEFQVNGSVKALRGGAYWVTLAYAFALALGNLIIFGWLFIRSARRRWPVTLMIVGQVANRTFVVLDSQGVSFPGAISPILFMFVLAFLIYTTALLRFHIFDPVPLARKAVLDQMAEGMLVVDLEGRVADANRTAGRILAKPPEELRGRAVGEVLPAGMPFLRTPDKTASLESEIILGAGNTIRYYDLNLSPLTDRRGELLGQIVLLHDITEQKRAQAQLIEQQRVVSTLEERERLARELHDSLGQVMGYVGLQAQTVGKWVKAGNTDKAESLLARLSEVARDAHADIRESILSLKAGTNQKWSFFPTLGRYLNDFETHYNVKTAMIVANGLKEGGLEPNAEVQLLRVIQEALTNARKHGGAHNVCVSFKSMNGRATITIADDGAGFDPNRPDSGDGEHFGLVFMRERMAQIGGSMSIDSQPGAGTTVKLDAPLSKGFRGTV